jgi:multisubunit Na+/H+ antiporter MnhG subunit
MPLLKGKSPLFMVIGFVLAVIGAIVWGRSESFSGMENHDKAVTMGTIGTVIFIVGVVLAGIGFLIGWNTKKR